MGRMDELRRAIALHSRPMRQHDPTRDRLPSPGKPTGPASAPLPAPPVRAPTISNVERRPLSNIDKLKLIAERRRDFNKTVSDSADRILDGYASATTKLADAEHKHMAQLKNEVQSMEDVHRAIDEMSNAPLDGS